MRTPALNALPALVVPAAAAWVLAARGIDLAAPAVVATVAVVAILLARDARPLLDPTAPVAWAGALVLWSAADGAFRPVAAFDAARCVAIGAIALALLAACGAPRVAAWGRLAVVATGTIAALWMVAERALRAGRPPGPFGNPNGAATLALLALALAPFLRAPAWVRAALAAAGAAGVVASGSRGALLGALAVAIVWAIGARHRRAFAVTAASVAAVAVLGIAIRLAVDRDPLRYERVRIWGVAARVAAGELPLGSGPGGYADAAIGRNFPRDGEFARFARIPDLPESDLLAAAACLGVPGVALVAGLLASVVVRLRTTGAAARGVVAAIVITSAVNSQAMIPGVTWAAALALGSVLPRRRGARRAGAGWAGRSAIVAVAVAAAAVLSLPEWGIGPSPERAAEQAADTLRAHTGDDAALADAEVRAWTACSARPRLARAWRTLGNIRLARAVARGEERLARAAADAFAGSRQVNPLDVWGALGEARARRAFADAPGAAQALAAAVRLEPNCAPAWGELAALRLELGQVEAARDAWQRARAIERRARGAVFVTDYERELARLDPTSSARLLAALGGER